MCSSTVYYLSVYYYFQVLNGEIIGSCLIFYVLQTVESAALRLLSVVLEGGDEAPCVLEWDTFSILVTLTLSLPSIFPSITGAAIGSQQVGKYCTRFNKLS